MISVSNESVRLLPTSFTFAVWTVEQPPPWRPKTRIPVNDLLSFLDILLLFDPIS